MTKGTVLVASPSAIGRMPEASGSRVPAWPAFLALKARFTTATAWVEVMPTRLSRMTQPETSRLLRPVGPRPALRAASFRVPALGVRAHR